MLTTTESRLLRVLIALRDATGAKTRTPVPEDDVAERLTTDPEIDGPVADELDDLERQGFALIETDRSGQRRVQMTAHGKIKAEEFAQMMVRAGTPLGQTRAPSAVATPAPSLAAVLGLRAAPVAEESAPAVVEASTPASLPDALPSAPLAPHEPGAGWSASVADMLDAVAQAIPLLPPDTAAVVSTLMDDARGALSAESPARARRALAALAGYLGDAASGALGNVLAAQMMALAPQLQD